MITILQVMMSWCFVVPIPYECGKFNNKNHLNLYWKKKYYVWNSKLINYKCSLHWIVQNLKYYHTCVGSIYLCRSTLIFNDIYLTLFIFDISVFRGNNVLDLLTISTFQFISWGGGGLGRWCSGKSFSQIHTIGKLCANFSRKRFDFFPLIFCLVKFLL